MSEEVKYFVFYNRIPNSTFIFPDGTQAAFTNGRYATPDADKAIYLNEVVKQGNPHIYLNEDKLVLTETELDPMAEYKARIIAEYLASQGAGNPEKDMGTSIQGKLNVADTSNIGAAAADSTSGVTPGVVVSIGKK